MQVDAAFLLELRRQVLDQAQVEVLTTEEGVTVGGQHLELVLAVHFGNLDDGDVEGTAAQVVDRHGAIALGLVHAIGQRRRGGLVDDALHFQAGDLAGVLGGLALGIVEVGRHGDHRGVDLLAQVLLGGFLHLAQDFGGHLGRRHLVVLHLDPGVAVLGLDDLVGDHADVFLHHIVLELAADQALDREQGVVRVGHRLALGALAHQDLAVLGIGDDGGGRAIALGVFNHFRLGAVHDRDTGVGRTQVDTDNLAHCIASFL